MALISVADNFGLIVASATPAYAAPMTISMYSMELLDTIAP